MKTKFTPGPWIAKNSSGAGLGIWADLRPALGEKFSKDFPIYENSLSAPKLQIAYETWAQFPSAEFNAMQEANAHLIAAAPDLYEALTHMQSCASCAEGGWLDCEGGRQAIAALEKARGEQP